MKSNNFTRSLHCCDGLKNIEEQINLDGFTNTENKKSRSIILSFLIRVVRWAVFVKQLLMV